MSLRCNLQEKEQIINIGKQMHESIQYAQQRNVNSTPTLVIEDVMLPNRTYSNLVKIINALLKEPVP